MSEKKTIQINPDLFHFPSTNKTRKKRNNPDQPNKPIKIKPITKPVTSKTIKNRLLKYIRQQQDTSYKQLSEPKPPIVKPSQSEPGFESDFEDSLKYLSSIAEKTQHSLPAEYRKGGHNTTLRQLPPTTESLLYGSTLHSNGMHTDVGVDLPNVFDTVEPTNQDNPMFLRNAVSNVANVPKFGCLKNGVLPTYRMWKNQTLRTPLGGNTNTVPYSRIGLTQDTGTSFSQSNTSSFTPRNTSSFMSNGISGTNTNPSMPMSINNTNPINSTIPQNTIIRNPSPVYNRPQSSTLGGKPEQIIEMEKHHEHRKHSLQQRPKNLFRKLKQKRTLRRTYRVGKSKHYSNVAVLVSNKTLRKQITTKSQLLKQVPMEEVKKTLIKKGFIKVGCTAPNDVLRKMYESVSLVCGDIQNHNPENLLYNYLHGGDA